MIQCTHAWKIQSVCNPQYLGRLSRERAGAPGRDITCLAFPANPIWTTEWANPNKKQLLFG